MKEKKPRSQSRKDTTQRSGILDRRLAKYGLTAGAVLAGGAAARAGVQYTAANITMDSSNTSQEIALDGTGVLSLGFSSKSASGIGTRRGSAKGTNGAQLAYGSRGNVVLNFPLSTFPGGATTATISNSARSANWGGTQKEWLFSYGFYTFANTHRFRGFFVSVHPGYIGVRFDPAGGTNWQYGWVHVDSVASDFTSYHVSGYAYETVAGASIQAGQMPSVPEPSALALFAAGAAGVLATRRRRKEKTEATS